MRKNCTALSIAMLLLMTACSYKEREYYSPTRFDVGAGQPEFDYALSYKLNENDPLEGFNRFVYGFNNVVDKVLLFHLAELYNLLPKFIRTGVSNAASNASSPLTLIHDLLQLKPKRAFDTLMRFSMNSTIGLAGLIDVAEKANLPYHSEDLGQTLAHYGFHQGPYLMLPFLGPSTTRQLYGRIGDFFIDPTGIFFKSKNLQYLNSARTAVPVIEFRTNQRETFRRLNRSPDAYAQIRTAFMQSREFKLNDEQSFVDGNNDSDTINDEDDLGPALEDE